MASERWGPRGGPRHPLRRELRPGEITRATVRNGESLGVSTLQPSLPLAIFSFFLFLFLAIRPCPFNPRNNDFCTILQFQSVWSSKTRLSVEDHNILIQLRGRYSNYVVFFRSFFF